MTKLKLLGVYFYQPGTDRKSGDIIAELTTSLLSITGLHACMDSVVNMMIQVMSQEPVSQYNGNFRWRYFGLAVITIFTRFF